MSAVLAVVVLAAAICAVLLITGRISLPDLASPSAEPPAAAVARPRVRSPGHQKMLEVLEVIAEQTNTRNGFMGGVQPASVTGEELAGLSPAQSEFARLTRLAMDSQGLGREQEAINYFQ